MQVRKEGVRECQGVRLAAPSIGTTRWVLQCRAQADFSGPLGTFSQAACGFRGLFRERKKWKKVSGRGWH